MKRQLADRARQAEALEKQQQLEQQKLDLLRNRGKDLVDIVSNAKEFHIERKVRPIQYPSSTDPIDSNASSTEIIAGVSGSTSIRTPTTPKSGTVAEESHNVDATVNCISSSTTSSSSSSAAIIKRDTPSSVQDVVLQQNHPSSPSLSNEDIQLQRPAKIPKLSNSVRNSPLNQDECPSSSLSAVEAATEPRTSYEGSNGDTGVHSTTSSSEPLRAQSSMRRLSLDPHTTTMNEITSSVHSNQDDNSSSEQSAFYLKHQNRALATELKSYQYSLSELLQERDIRRLHCSNIFQSVQQLLIIWNSMENAIIATNNTNHQSKSVNNTSANYDNNVESDVIHLNEDNAIASTGSDDSIEWTSALLKALKDLGSCTLTPSQLDSSLTSMSQNMNGNKVTDCNDIGTSYSTAQDGTDGNNDHQSTEKMIINISARAKILQDWVQKILEKPRQIISNDMKGNATADCTESTTIQVLLTRCATLESQVRELVTCRNDLIQRERRLRRNIYRMASNLLSPEQVVSSAMMRPEDLESNHRNDVDDIETAVQLEKQELLLLQKEHQELLETINATKSVQPSSMATEGDTACSYPETPHISQLLSKRIDEYQIKMTQLEESVGIANETIQQVRHPFKTIFLLWEVPHSLFCTILLTY
jgi:hypothetical protein